MFHAPRIAIDIGGTFTDIALGQDQRILATTKLLTTHSDPANAALQGATEVIAGAGLSMADLGGVVHGTTLATNALIERRGARVACVLTEGFRDILEIAYERRYSQYDIDLEKPDLIVPRSRCFTMPERTSVRGEILKPLDEGAMPRLLAELDASGADAVAICLLHSYAQPAHERRLRELILDARPHLSISLSCEVSPEAREFDRLCTTVANAYVQPLMSGYLAAFASAFSDAGLKTPILMMTAGGGMTTLETAARFPIRLVESGPAGGALLAARLARACEIEDVLSLDIGGTTAKLCLIDQGRPQSTRQFEIARAARFIKGSGMPVRIPVIEMIEIGAGGGSIARVDGMGRLSVGPDSAGSDPGPAAYGHGGTDPTVSDGDIAMGLIDPARFAEGRIQLDLDACNDAVTNGVGTPLGLDVSTAAAGIAAIVDENMASAARVHAIESGKDLAKRTMIAFGGNGPLHATRVAARAGVSRIIVPRDPGVGSAVGFLYAPVGFEIVRSLHTELDGIDLAALNALLDEMQAEAEAVVRLASDGPVERERWAFMRYVGQGHEIEVPLPAGSLTANDLPALRDAFESSYRQQFSRPVPGMRIEILNWAVRVSTPEPSPDPVKAAPPGDALASSAERVIHCDVGGPETRAGLFERHNLKPGDRISGPALIVEPQTTTLVSTGWAALVDGDGNLILEDQR